MHWMATCLERFHSLPHAHSYCVSTVGPLAQPQHGSVAEPSLEQARQQLWRESDNRVQFWRTCLKASTASSSTGDYFTSEPYQTPGQYVANTHFMSSLTLVISRQTATLISLDTRLGTAWCDYVFLLVDPLCGRHCSCNHICKTRQKGQLVSIFRRQNEFVPYQRANYQCEVSPANSETPDVETRSPITQGRD